jgi:hypothetical protein
VQPVEIGDRESGTPAAELMGVPGGHRPYILGVE